MVFYIPSWEIDVFGGFPGDFLGHRLCFLKEFLGFCFGEFLSGGFFILVAFIFLKLGGVSQEVFEGFFPKVFPFFLGDVFRVSKLLCTHQKQFCQK